MSIGRSSLLAVRAFRLSLFLPAVIVAVSLCNAALESGQSLENISSTALRHQAFCRSLSPAMFEYDWSNRISGRIVTRDGRPASRAIVSVYKRADLDRAWNSASPGTWPSALAERTTIADDEGHYLLRDLSYGLKYMTFSLPQSAASAKRECIHLDGVAREFDIVLPTGPVSVWRFLESDGRPATGIDVAPIPDIVGCEMRHFLTDSDGRILCNHEPLAEGITEILVDNPPTCIRRTRTEDGHIVLPERMIANIVCKGLRDGMATISLMPKHAQRVGYTRIAVRIVDESVSGLWLRSGEYGILISQDDRVAWDWVAQDGSPICMQSYDVGSLRMCLGSQDKAGDPARVLWIPSPTAPLPDYPRTLSERLDLTPMVSGSAMSSPDGSIILNGVSAAPAVLFCVAGGLAPKRIIKDVGFEDIELPSSKSARLLICSRRPFLEVAVENGNTVQRGMLDRYGECVCWVTPGPAVVRLRSEEDHWSAPIGCWVGNVEHEVQVIPDQTDLEFHYVYGFMALGSASAIVTVSEDGVEIASATVRDDGFYCAAVEGYGVYDLTVHGEEVSAGLGASVVLSDDHPDARMDIKSNREHASRIDEPR